MSKSALLIILICVIGTVFFGGGYLFLDQQSKSKIHAVPTLTPYPTTPFNGKKLTLPLNEVQKHVFLNNITYRVLGTIKKITPTDKGKIIELEEKIDHLPKIIATTKTYVTYVDKAGKNKKIKNSNLAQGQSVTIFLVYNPLAKQWFTQRMVITSKDFQLKTASKSATLRK